MPVIELLPREAVTTRSRFGGVIVDPEFCSASCDHTGCDEWGYVSETRLHGAEQAGEHVRLLCPDHAETRR